MYTILFLFFDFLKEIFNIFEQEVRYVTDDIKFHLGSVWLEMKQGEWKIEERKVILWVFGWREGEDGKLVEPRCILPWPTKIVSLQFEEKIEGRGIVTGNN